MQKFQQEDDAPDTRWNFAEWKTRFVVKAVLVPFIAGCALTFLSYRIFLWSLDAPISLLAIYVFAFTAGIVTCISGLLLIVTILTKIGRHFPARRHGITDGLAAIIAFYAAVYGGPSLTKSLFLDVKAAEERALLTNGAEGTFPVVRRTLQTGHGRHFYLYIAVPDLTRRAHELDVYYPDTPGTAATDSITVRYLPANPEHFQTLE